ncbi:MAG: CvpA family protein [Planctomycetota bacterium]
MAIYDWLMLIVMTVAMVWGGLKGFAWQLASITSIAMSYAVAYNYREPFSGNIHWDEPSNRFLAMLILFIGTSLVASVLLRMFSGIITRITLKEFDRQMGAFFGLLKGGLICVLITLFAITLMGQSTQKQISQSRSGQLITKLLDQTDIVMPPELDHVVGPMLARMANEPQATESGFRQQSIPQMGATWQMDSRSNPAASQWRQAGPVTSAPWR